MINGIKPLVFRNNKRIKFKIPKENEIIPPVDSDYIWPNDFGIAATQDGRLMKIESLFEEDSQFYHESTSDNISYNELEDRYYLTKNVWSGVIRGYTDKLRCPIYVEGEYYPIGDVKIGELLCAGTNGNPINPETLSINIKNTVPCAYNGSSQLINELNPIAIATYSPFPGIISSIYNPNSIDVKNHLNGKNITWMLKNPIKLPLLKKGEIVNTTGVKLNKRIIGLKTNEIKKIDYTVKPLTASNKNVMWTSSDDSIATVKDGVVTPLKEGNVKITVTTVDGGFKSTVDVMIYEPYTEDKLFNGAYVQMYYYEPKINLGEDLIIPYYISDEKLMDFYDDDGSKTFTLIVSIDGVETRHTGLRAGDQEVNLGKLSEGEHSIIFQGIDETNGSKGMAIYKEVWIVNPKTYTITEEQTHYMTQGDLIDFNINNQNSDTIEDCDNNRNGINSMIEYYKSNGFRKLVMLPGIYRVNCLDRTNSVIKIPTNFTLDGNGCTFKRKPFLSYPTPGLTVFLFKDTIDSHLINCTIESDAQERIDADLDWYNYDQPNGEGFNVVYIEGGRYSSLQNVNITQAVGHAVITESGKSIGFSLPDYEFDITKPSIASENNDVGKYAIINGDKVYGEKYLTNPMIDLSDWGKRNNSRFIIFGNNTGYSWFKGVSQCVYYHFYDEDGDYVTSIPSMQFRPVMIPNGCRYARITMNSYKNDTEGAGFFYKEQGTHLSLSNNHFENCRTTAYAPKCSRGLLMENNSYVNCGRKITPCDVDFEDGWQQSIDVYYRNNTTTPHPKSSSTVITVAGVNHVYENNINHHFHGKHYLYGCVHRRSSKDRAILVGIWLEHESKNNRIYNNENCSVSFVHWVGELTQENILSGQSHGYVGINGGSYTKFPGGYKLFNTNKDYHNNIVKNSKIKGSGAETWLVKCDIHPVLYLGKNLIFEKCKFYNFDNIDESIKLSMNTGSHNSIFKECNFNSPTNISHHNVFSGGIWENCTFNKMVIMDPRTANSMGDIQFNDCIFKDTVTIKHGNTSFVQFNNCVFEKGKTIQGVSDNVEFNDCIG